MTDLPHKLAFIDVETTGGNTQTGRIIEIGVLRVENNTLVKTFHSLINPGCFLPPEITHLTGITPNDLENAPTFRQLQDEVEDILADCIFVAHNVRFDLSFVRNEMKRLGKTFSPRHFCTVKLSKSLFPRYKKHNLDVLIKRYGFACEQRHRAFHDASVLWQFYQLILEKFPTEKVLTSLNTVLKRPALPIGLSQDTLDSLPDTPGVYIFYGDNGMPLYVGKSVNIRNRVLSHFSSDHASSVEMKISQQVQSVEVVKTQGELGALLTESQLIKQLQPLYNRKLRYARDLVILRRLKNGTPYAKVVQDERDTSRSTLEDIDSVLGVFKSTRHAKQFLIRIAQEYQLCDKLLGIEKTNRTCFGYQLKRCKGACIGKESPARYNMRFENAFAKTKIQEWPFKGPIVIREGEGEDSESFVIHEWCYLGTIKGVSQETPHHVSRRPFDYDMYTILKRYVNQLKPRKNITNLKTISWV